MSYSHYRVVIHVGRDGDGKVDPALAVADVEYDPDDDTLTPIAEGVAVHRLGDVIAEHAARIERSGR